MNLKADLVNDFFPIETRKKRSFNQNRIPELTLVDELSKPRKESLF